MNTVAGAGVAAVVNGGSTSSVTVVLTGLLALVAVTANSWFLHLDTAVHEGGHALAAYLAGGRVWGVWLDQDGGGATMFSGRRRGSGRVMTAAAGYVSPSVVGLCSARLLAAGNITAVLILAVLALGCLLLLVRNRFGIVVVIAAGASLILAGRYTPAWAQAAYAHFLTWFLLFSGPKSVLILHRARRRGAEGSDADMLAELTHVPALIWVFGFGALSLWCAVKGAGLLLR